MNDQEKYHNLCIKKMTSEISHAEKKELISWRQTNAANEQFYQEMAAMWQQAEPVELPEKPNKNAEWQSLANSLGLESQPSFWEKIAGIFEPLLMPKPRFAFALVLLIVSGIWLSHFFWWGQRYIVVLTKNNQHREVILSDGSHVQLNCGSRIACYRNFSDTLRQLTLSGEAFFDITPDKSRPFVIQTENARVRVLGTKFNVWAREKKTRVVVQKGTVALCASDQDSGKVILNKNQMSSIENSALPQKPISVKADSLIGWISGKLIFDRTPLSEIVRELERWYNVKIVLENTSLASETVTGTFQDVELEVILASICTTLDAQFKLENNQYILKGSD